MLTLSLVLAASLCTQHFRESKHDPFTQVVDRRSPALVAKLKKQHDAMHQAAEQSRRDFDGAMAILNAPAMLDCPCHALFRSRTQ